MNLARLSLENNYYDHILLERCSLKSHGQKSECLLLPRGMHISELWHNLPNVSALHIAGRTMKKKEIYENRQMNLRSLLALGEKAMK